MIEGLLVMPGTTNPHSELIERPQRQYPIAIADPDFVELVGMPTVLTKANPDGPKAAEAIQSLQVENERLRDGLRPFAEPHAMGDQYVKFAPRLILHARTLLGDS